MRRYFMWSIAGLINKERKNNVVLTNTINLCDLEIEFVRKNLSRKNNFDVI